MSRSLRFCRNAHIALATAISVAAALAEAPPISLSAVPEQPERTVAEEAAVLEKGRLSARRRALARLATHADPEAVKVLVAQFERYRSRELPAGLWLDLFEAAAKRNDPKLTAMLKEREESLEKSANLLSRFRECLEGGDADAGRLVFATKAEAGCIRCHSVDGGREDWPGTDVAPAFNGPDSDPRIHRRAKLHDRAGLCERFRDVEKR